MVAVRCLFLLCDPSLPVRCTAVAAILLAAVISSPYSTKHTQVYIADLAEYPNNPWALRGLQQVYQQQLGTDDGTAATKLQQVCQWLRDSAVQTCLNCDRPDVARQCGALWWQQTRTHGCVLFRDPSL